MGLFTKNRREDAGCKSKTVKCLQVLMKYKHKVDKLIQIALKMQKKKVPLLPKIIKNTVRAIYACDVSLETQIDQTSTFMHNGLGTVVGKGSVIGANVTVYQNVTLGGNGRSTGNGKPVIEHDCVIYAGSMILGDVRVGNNSIIGANSVLLESVPPYSLAVGTPAKVIKTLKKD